MRAAGATALRATGRDDAEGVEVSMTGSATATAAIMTSSLVLMAGSIRAVLSAARQGTASPRSLVVSGAMLALGICGFASSVLLLGANG